MVCEHAIRPDHINRERASDLAQLRFALDSCSDESRAADLREHIGAIETLMQVRRPN